MIDVKHYLYHRGSGKSNAAKEQGKAHYELYKATLQECKDNLSKPETHDDLAIRMRAFFPDDEGRRIYQKGLARILYPKVLPVIDKRLPQPKVLPPAYESGAKRGASSVHDEAEQRKQARRDEPAAAPSPTKPKTAPSYADPAWPAVPPPKPDAPPPKTNFSSAASSILNRAPKLAAPPPAPAPAPPPATAPHIKNEHIFGGKSETAPARASSPVGKLAPRPPEPRNQVEQQRYGGYSPATSGSALTVTKINQVKDLLGNALSNPELLQATDVLRAIRSLAPLKMSIALLQETDIGKVFANFARKYAGDASVKDEAAALVKKWSADMKKEAAEQREQKELSAVAGPSEPEVVITGSSDAKSAQRKREPPPLHPNLEKKPSSSGSVKAYGAGYHPALNTQFGDEEEGKEPAQVEDGAGSCWFKMARPRFETALETPFGRRPRRLSCRAAAWRCRGPLRASRNAMGGGRMARCLQRGPAPSSTCGGSLPSSS